MMAFVSTVGYVEYLIYCCTVGHVSVSDACKSVKYVVVRATCPVHHVTSDTLQPTSLGYIYSIFTIHHSMSHSLPHT
jgi:hypothetical protein